MVLTFVQDCPASSISAFQSSMQSRRPTERYGITHTQYPWPDRSSRHADLLQVRRTPASTIDAGGELQTSLSSVKATPPTFVQACSILDLNPSRPVLELEPAALPSDRPAAAVRTLKPWQVRMLARERPMEQSKLSLWLLADEIALRKRSRRSPI